MFWIVFVLTSNQICSQSSFIQVLTIDATLQEKMWQQYLHASLRIGRTREDNSQSKLLWTLALKAALTYTYSLGASDCSQFYWLLDICNDIKETHAYLSSNAAFTESLDTASAGHLKRFNVYDKGSVQEATAKTIYWLFQSLGIVTGIEILEIHFSWIVSGHCLHKVTVNKTSTTVSTQFLNKFPTPTPTPAQNQLEYSTSYFRS